MINVFKKIRIAYLICHIFICVSFITSITIHLFIDDFAALYTQLILFPIVIFAETIGFEIIANRKHAKLCAIHNEECDPVKFLNEYFPLLKRAKEKSTRSLLMLNLASGYINIGDLAQAKSVLGDININHLNKMTRIQYHNLWTTIFMNEEKTGDAQYSLNFTKDLLAKTKLNPLYKDLFEKSIRSDEAELNILRGNFDGAEEVFLENFYTSKEKLRKVIAKYILANLYIKQNNTEKAVEAMKYVAENGNTLYMAQKAKEYLNSLR